MSETGISVLASKLGSILHLYTAPETKFLSLRSRILENDTTTARCEGRTDRRSSGATCPLRSVAGGCVSPRRETLQTVWWLGPTSETVLASPRIRRESFAGVPGGEPRCGVQPGLPYWPSGMRGIMHQALSVRPDFSLSVQTASTVAGIEAR